ncbi:MAG TPA: PaaI family thioesterase [Acidimicrobiales bacterium]|jgi:acyl-coenzyme A thioesterase PaaI-like protein
MADDDFDLRRMRWAKPEPGRLVGRGHTAGDFLEAYDWVVLEKRQGYLRLEAGLPEQVRNPRGQMFGGFTPTYVDLVALFTVRMGVEGSVDGPPRHWLATSQMRLDYFEPITGPRFVIESELEKRRGRTNFVLTRFFQDDELAVLAATTIREVKLDRPLGDA